MYSIVVLFVVLFLVFVLALVVYSFLKVRIGFNLDYHTPVKLPQNIVEEKRKSPRADINWSARMETSDGTVVAEVRNISLGGAFICCKKPLPLGQVFPLTMIGPDNERVVATAEVVWSNVNVPDERVVNRGMGVRFIKMSDRLIQLVRQLFQESD